MKRFIFLAALVPAIAVIAGCEADRDLEGIRRDIVEMETAIGAKPKIDRAARLQMENMHLIDDIAQLKNRIAAIKDSQSRQKQALLAQLAKLQQKLGAIQQQIRERNCGRGVWIERHYQPPPARIRPCPRP